MEIKCQHCDHIGAPSSLKPIEKGLALICSKCGLDNLVENDIPSVGETKTSTSKSVEIPDEVDSADFNSDENFQKLIPKQGDGFRCPKCLSILSEEKLAPTKNCRICGLGLQRDYTNLRDLPWERAPEGKEGLFEQGVLLWKSLEENPTALQFEKFIEFTNASGLHDLQIRKLRQFLVAYPTDENALKYLRIQSDQIQTRIVVAQSQSQSQTQQLGSQVESARQKLMIGVAIALILLIVFFVNFIYK